MADIERLIETKSLGTSLWRDTVKGDGSQVNLYYNKRVDALVLLIVGPETDQVVHYIDDYIGLIYDPGNLEIIGVRVESFQKSFLPKYDQLEAAWRLSESGVQVQDFGDLTIAVRTYEEMKPLVANEISRITARLARPQGIRLQPVPA